MISSTLLSYYIKIYIVYMKKSSYILLTLTKHSQIWNEMCGFGQSMDASDSKTSRGIFTLGSTSWLEKGKYEKTALPGWAHAAGCWRAASLKTKTLKLPKRH